MESSGVTLQQVFDGFNGKEKTMEGKVWSKLCKDCKLYDKKYTTTDADLIFAKVKAKTERRITFAEFNNALKQVADKKGVDVEVVKATVLQAGGPTFSGTKAEAVKYHDDKSLYTGVHASGGPTTVDSIAPTASFGSAPAKEETKTAPGTKKAVVAATSSAPAGSLQEAFTNFTGGAAEMEGKTLQKVAKDCHLLDKALTTTDVDLIFAKVKDKAAKKINFIQFQAAVEQFAAKKKTTAEKISQAICAAGGPVFKGTKAEAVKYHDDKSLYTGVYAAGGPTTVDAGKGVISDISQLCDRSDADVRGSKK